MSKKDKTGSKDKRRRGNKKSTAIGWLVGLGAAASLIFAFIFFWPQSEPWGLPAISRNPRPATLPPELFTGRVAEVYRIAQEVPELLE